MGKTERGRERVRESENETLRNIVRETEFWRELRSVCVSSVIAATFTTSILYVEGEMVPILRRCLSPFFSHSPQKRRIKNTRTHKHARERRKSSSKPWDKFSGSASPILSCERFPLPFFRSGSSPRQSPQHMDYFYKSTNC